jgi:hypothetical protein
MLPEGTLLSSLIYFSVIYPSINIIFKSHGFYSCIGICVALWTIKCVVEQQLNPNINLYEILGVSRHSSPFQIRKEFRNLKKQLDAARLQDPIAQADYTTIKNSYDIMMDESNREIYNLFGEDYIDADPRKDELSMLIAIMACYIFFGISAHIMSMPRAARACRTWIMILLVFMMIFDFMIRVIGYISIPKWYLLPSTMTEFELLGVFFNVLPLAIAILRCVAEKLYVDSDLTTKEVVITMTQQKQELKTLLYSMKSLLKNNRNRDQEQDKRNNLAAVRQELIRVNKISQEYGDKADHMIKALKTTNSNPISNYYWIIFIVIYASMYLFQ